ncbi:MAG: formyltransferase family protein [Pseudomonadota bacterium]
MSRRIVFLNGGEEAPYFEEFLRAQNPDIAVSNVTDVQALEDVVTESGGHVRLISFLTSIIVPSRILTRLTLTPYNIHPATPDYPGSHPESWAIWEGAGEFGATAHEMTARVDDGPIVAVLRYAMPPDPQRVALNDHNYAEALKVFAVVVNHCAQTDNPMPHMAETWGRVKRTKKDFAALCRVPTGLSGEALARLRAACGPSLKMPEGMNAA